MEKRKNLNVILTTGLICGVFGFILSFFVQTFRPMIILLSAAVVAWMAVVYVVVKYRKSLSLKFMTFAMLALFIGRLVAMLSLTEIAVFCYLICFCLLCTCLFRFALWMNKYALRDMDKKLNDLK